MHNCATIVNAKIGENLFAGYSIFEVKMRKLLHKLWTRNDGLIIIVRKNF